ncbi:MAG: S46 family peptidase [Limisphaerales bacterium]
MNTRLALTTAALLAAAPAPHADEGMWLYNDPPRALLRERHGFDAPPEWYEHLQRASVRFNSGGSGSFVSADGLVMSNHHVGADAIQKLSTPERDLMRDGFLAKSAADELPCKDLELNVLASIEDVTARVTAAVKPGLAPEEALAARRAVLAEIERESLENTGLRSDVITLFQGGAYHLYRFKKYTDVRLVFAPEQQVAFFGGDPDNFEYPRWCLDVAFFRAYENGRPAQVEHSLKWSEAGAEEGELIFVSGHPGRTSRLLTMAELEYLRDRQFPYTLEYLAQREVYLTAWGGRSAENARRAKDDLFGVQNSRKARLGGIGGLQDPALMARKAAAEQALRDTMAKDARWAGALGAFDRIASAQREIGQHALRYRLLEGGHGFQGELFDIARTLLRAGDEFSRPNTERLPEYRDSGKESLELELFSTKPIYEDFEILRLTAGLSFLQQQLGATDPLVQAVMAGKSPRARAEEVVRGTKLREVGMRRDLYRAGAAGVRTAGDPLVELARTVDDEARRLRKAVEVQDEIKQQAHAEIAEARFALQGSGTYPDATFTLRLAVGVVKAGTENGEPVPPFTTFAGLFERSKQMGGRPPFDLPERWLERRGRLDLDTPFNFIHTADIIGGNSGSPTVNRDGEVVGLIFDGNLASLVLDFVYDDQYARALSVDSRGILEALRRVYDAKALADEITGKRRPKA